MGELHRYRALKTYANKVFSFKQGKVVGDGEGLPHGNCTPLSLVWIKEKVSFSESSYSFSRLRGTPSFRAGDRQAIANAAISLSRVTFTNADVITSMERAIGLDRVPVDSISLVSTGLPGLRNQVTVDEPIANSLLTLVTSVPNGYALLFAVKRGSAVDAHAVAIYVSRGGTTYFFDPNAGVYEIFNIEPFFSTWSNIMDGNATWYHIEYGSRNLKLPYRIYAR